MRSFRGFQLRRNHARVSSPRFSLPLPHAPLFSTYSFRYFAPTTQIRCRCSAVVGRCSTAVGRWSKVEQQFIGRERLKFHVTRSPQSWNPLSSFFLFHPDRLKRYVARLTLCSNYQQRSTRLIVSRLSFIVFE